MTGLLFLGGDALGGLGWTALARRLASKPLKLCVLFQRTPLKPCEQALRACSPSLLSAPSALSEGGRC